MHERNALIDGWRGVSVALVILSHLLGYRLGAGSQSLQVHEFLAAYLGAWAGVVENLFIFLAQYAYMLAALGVHIFFLISGFLITSLLLAEGTRNGSVSILAFYVRRIFRIMPPFYFMILVTVLLGRYGLIELPRGVAIRSGLFACDFDSSGCSWWLSHTWSLAVEEQFYLFWPAMFLLPITLRRFTITTLPIALPVLSYYLPVLSQFEFIAVGAFVASRRRVLEVMDRLAATSLTVVALAAILILSAPFMGAYPRILSGFALAQPGVLGFVVFGALSGRSLMSGVIALRTLQQIGVMSYSLYLWQQLSLAPLISEGMNTGADIFLRTSIVFTGIFILPAIISYCLLEKPLIAVGRTWSTRIIERRRSHYQTITV
jgi:peptidoglycan/LPS O-acetylase OafA/YrhL